MTVPSDREIGSAAFTFICDNFIKNSSTITIKKGLQIAMKLLDVLQPEVQKVEPKTFYEIPEKKICKIDPKIEPKKRKPKKVETPFNPIPVKTKKKSRKPRADKGQARDRRSY